MTDRDDFERFVAFERQLDERVCERSERFGHGVAYLVDELPRVYWLNLLVADRDSTATAAELAAAADRIQGGAGLLHRQVAIDAEAQALRLRDGFLRLGWTVSEHRVLVHRGPVPAEAAGEEADADTLEPLLLAEHAADGFGEETARQLVAARRRLVGAARARFFTVRVDGEPAAHCELFSDGTTAQIENVGTLARHRGRGLGTAVVTSALRAAAGHERVFVVADAADWPGAWYERLGFAPVGRLWEFLRTPGVLRGIRLRTPRLELRLPAERELRALGELARRGVHPPERTPFYVPWTDRAGEPGFVDDVVAHHVERLAAFAPGSWTLGFAVFHEGEPVGIQALRGVDFPSARVVDSGSWLGESFQNRGLGAEMRAAVLELAFRGLGAVAATSGAMVDNPQSQRVSAKLGYEQVGETVQRPRGEPVRELLYRLDRDAWTSPVPVELEAVEPALPLFGLHGR